MAKAAGGQGGSCGILLTLVDTWMRFAAELAPEWAWQEADFVRNVTVRDNVINTNGTGIWLGIDPWHWKGPPGPTK